MKTVGKYIIRGLLGRGGMSRIYLAEIPTISRLVALKELYPAPMLRHLMAPGEAKRRFFAEATAMSMLQHRHVAQIWDFEETPDRLFYTMEYHPTTLGSLIGETWRVEMPSRRLPLDTAIGFLSQILEGLSAMHDADIVHRDLKPFNILVTADSRIKIADFGLSKLRGERFQGHPSLKIGSPYYAAPEQETAPEDADASADLYAAGVIGYRMLTGRLPALSRTSIVKDTPFLDDAWTAFFQRALHPIPENRFASAAQMSDALGRLDRKWQGTRQSICQLTDVETPPDASPEPRHIRHEPVKLLANDTARAAFGVTRLWEPADYRQIPFESHGDGRILDPVNHLQWQQSGAPHPMTWEGAHRYVSQLNSALSPHAPRWRLPTVNELLTLIGHPATDVRRFCAPAIFERRQRNIWTCDRRTFTSAYVVRVDIGCVSWQDRHARADVRAVRLERI